MSIIEQHPDILQNIEFAIVAVYRDHPELSDPDTIAAMEKLISYYTRAKKRATRTPCDSACDKYDRI